RRTRRTGSSPGLLLLHYLSARSEKRAGQNSVVSVPCDDRRRATIATPIEPVVQTSPDDVIALTEKVGVVEVVEDEIVVVVVGTTNVGVEILDFDAQISEEGPFIAEGIFNARAGSIAE